MAEKIEALLADWGADLRGDGMAPKGIVSYRRIVKRVAQWLDPDAAVDDLTEELIIAYRNERMAVGDAPKSVGLWLSAIRNFCRWCVRTGRLASDPTEHIRWPKLPRPRPRYLSSSELAALYAALERPRSDHAKLVRLWERNRRAMLIMLHAGLRIKEVADLAWESVDLGRAMLRVEHGKGDKARDIPISAALAAELQRVPAGERRGAVCGHKNGDHITEKSMGHVFERWLPAQGVTGVSAHRLRHTAATLMRDGGADLDAIQAILGHESLETTQIYLGPNPERLRAAVEAIPAAPRPALRLVKTGA